MSLSNKENLIPLQIVKNELSRERIKSMLISVNYHLIKSCNYRCVFCFARFEQVTTNYLPMKKSIQLIDLLHEYGTEKITFVGGEPTLVPFLPELVIHAKSIGLTTMIVTNGTKLTEDYLLRFENSLDWVGLSIDSSIEAVSKQLGRGDGSHVKQTLRNAKLLDKFGIKIKLNTVVTEKTWNENMSWLLEKIQPQRWKVFKMLLIKGENDNAVNLDISDDQFNYFINQHQQYNPIVEDNDAMIDSYLMIDPQGRFYNNTNGELRHGKPILDCGIEEALNFLNFKYHKFEARGGKYSWN